MTDADKLRRLADLSGAIARRLNEVQTWTSDDKTQHKADLAERDVLLASASPAYLILAHRGRHISGAIETATAPWKLRVVSWLARQI